MASLLETFYGTGTFQRPDGSGIRGQGVVRKAQQSGGDDYPYDKPRGKWGEPHPYSRDSKGGSLGKNTMTPKKVPPGDDRWDDDLDEIKIDGWQSGTPADGNIVKNPPRDGSKFGIDGDDGMGEATGVPFNVAKGNQGTGASGGRTMPGTGGSWSAGPVGDQWDDRMDPDKLEDEGDVEETTNGLAMRTNNMYRYRPPNKPGERDDEEEQVRNMLSFHIPDDDETRDDVGWAAVKKHGGAAFGTPGQATKYSRMQPGFTWKESMQRVFEVRSSREGIKPDFRGIYERRVSRCGEK